MALEHLKKAEHFLEAAKSEVKNKFYDICVSNSYYCMYHTARALLLLLHQSPKTHSGLIHVLIQHCSELGLSKSDVSKMSRYLNERIRVDYEVALEIPSQRTAQDAVQDAEQFLLKSKQIIENWKNK